MGNHLKVCGCRQCRMNSMYRRKLLRKLIKAARRKAKEVLRRGDEPSPTILAGYTD